MSERREQMAEIIAATKAAAKSGISKIGIVGFVAALLVFALCSAPFMVGLWWWNQPSQPQYKAVPVIQPLNAPELCSADEWLGWYETTQGRVYFCTPKAK